MVRSEARDLVKRVRHQRSCVHMKVRNVGVRRVGLYDVCMRERGGWGRQGCGIEVPIDKNLLSTINKNAY